MTYQEIFETLWVDYLAQNPAVKNVYELFLSHGELVVNDHVAFRTFSDDRIGIDKLAAVFKKVDYVQAGEYFFPEKKLRAIHFEHELDIAAPRVFISELLVDEFSDGFREIVKGIVNSIPEKMLNSDKLIYSGTLWGEISYKTYEALRKESEYAAWLYAFGFRANHFTISINHLKNFSEISKVNTLLKSNGFLLNDSGGEIKGSPEQFLEQSSIKAGIINYPFVEGNQHIPGCYYEFAKRYPTSSGELYGGFIADSANKVFESTDFRKSES